METSSFFENIFNKTSQNSILIMQETGIVNCINEAFTVNFGYKNEDVKGKMFDIFFTHDDIKKGLPDSELNTVLNNGKAIDNNFMVHKNGNLVWVSGESVLINSGKENVIVKIIQNIHSQKVLEHLLTDANTLLDKLFNITNHYPLVLLDSAMRIIKANDPFLKLFKIDHTQIGGKKLSELENNFWSDKNVNAALRRMAIKEQDLSGQTFPYKDGGGQDVNLQLEAKNIYDKSDADKKTLLIVKVAG
jgi:PAS domain S-box-containing protein